MHDPFHQEDTHALCFIKMVSVHQMDCIDALIKVVGGAHFGFDMFSENMTIHQSCQGATSIASAAVMKCPTGGLSKNFIMDSQVAGVMAGKLTSKVLL
jgi:hypothetical protein